MTDPTAEPQPEPQAEPQAGIKVHNALLDYNDERAKTYIELAKLSQDGFLNRRSYEWKVAFGLWITIGFITYYACKNTDLLQVWTVISIGVLYLAVAVIWFFLWQVPLRRAFEQDKEFKHYYMHRAEGWSAKWPENITYEKVLKSVKNPWNYGQTIITVAFLAASFMVLVIASQKSESTKSAKLEIKASGKNIKVQAETHNK